MNFQFEYLSVFSHTFRTIINSRHHDNNHPCAYVYKENRARNGATPPVCLVAKLFGSFGLRASCLDTFGSKLGAVKKSLLWIMQVDTLWGKFSTCFLMYRRNASLDHQPSIIIVKVATSARYIVMDSPDLIEWVSMSSGLKPRMYSQML